MERKRIYFDHAAATPLDSRVKSAMMPYLCKAYGNPSALYASGREAKRAVERAREKVAEILKASSDEIFFTGSGTESIAMALFGVMRKNAIHRGASRKQGHFITSAIEHHAVLGNAGKLESEGFEVTSVKPDDGGIINPRNIEKAIKPETILVSVMYANNEIGTIQPISEIAEILRAYRKKNNQRLPFFHTDACQAAAYLPLGVRTLGVDCMTINGSKIYGPKGTGILYKKRGVSLEPLWEGGGQEMGMRSGTENTAGIVGIAEALELVQKRRAKECRRLAILRDYFIRELFRRVPKIVLNGHAQQRLPNNANISFLDIEGEAALLHLDRMGIEAATGSACDSSTLEPSHVILALGRPYEFAHASIRFTFGKDTTRKKIDYALTILPGVVQKLRRISPVCLTMPS